VTGTGESLALLRERFRYTTIYMGVPLFAVFHGDLIQDTARVGRAAAGRRAGTGAPEVTTRFFLTHLDTLRAREESDCRGR
jgi:hypothetical protein